MIIWGTKEVRRRLGYVADFCPLCRDLRAFEVTRVGMAGHIYYLSFGEGQLAGYNRTCCTCGTALNAAPDSYKTLGERLLPVAELAAQTFPNLKEAYAARLALEKSLRNPLARNEPGERAALLKEPFILLSPRVEQRFNSTHFDWQTLAAFFGGFLVGMPLIIALVEALLPSIKDEAVLVAIGAVVVATGAQMALAGGRWMRKQLFPILVPALLPLKPTPAELETVLKDMKTLGRKIGSKVRLADLLEAMQSHGAAARAAPGSVPAL